MSKFDFDLIKLKAVSWACINRSFALYLFKMGYIPLAAGVAGDRD